MKKIFFLLIIMAGFYRPVLAQEHALVLSDEKGWHKIAETSVDFKNEKQEVVLHGANRFAALKFAVTDAPIDLQTMEIYYDSGDKQAIEFNTTLSIGTKSKQIDLNGGERNIDKIIFAYHTVPNSKDEKAHVEIWGLKTNTEEPNRAISETGRSNNADRKEAAPDKENSSSVANRKAPAKAESSSSPSIVVDDSKGWHKIGERSVDLTRDKDEVVLVGANRFAAIKLKVTESAIDLRDVTVYYDKGDVQNLGIHGIFYAGDESTSMDLKGGLERDISKIVFVYKTLPNRKETKANIEIWGLKTNQVHND